MPRSLLPLDAALSEYSEHWNEFAAVLDEIEARLDALPPGTAWPIAGASGIEVGIVTLADFLHKFDNLSWSLTDRDYSGVNGGVGQVGSRFQNGVWQSAAEEIRASEFAIYMNKPERRGAVYLALHEVAHVTKLGLHVWRTMFDEFIHAGGQADQYSRSQQWWYNERLANRIALTVANEIGMAILDKPTGGYNLDVIIRQMEFA